VGEISSLHDKKHGAVTCTKDFFGKKGSNSSYVHVIKRLNLPYLDHRFLYVANKKVGLENFQL
jgi:hypothetical protein